MNRVAKITVFERGSEGDSVRVDTGGGADKTADHFGPPGDDSQPLPDDYASIAGSAGTGRESVTGYHDSTNTPKAQAGEVRRYARSPATRAPVGEMWLKNDGTIVFQNAGGWGITVSPEGIIVIKGSRVVLDTPDAKTGTGASRSLALVGDAIAGTLDVSSGSVAGSILGPGSAAGSG